MTQTQVVDTVAYYPSVHSNAYFSMESIEQRGKMRGAQRVITFCLLTAVLPVVLLIIPLYLRHSVYADTTYAVAESDVIEINDGISSIFCQQHALKMNTSFQAFQVKGPPQLSSNRKHIRLKKSMSLPDDTLEYWGFYLLKGSTVILSLCSRYSGSRILVVEGERNLRTCGLMDHSEKPVNPHMANGRGQVRVTFNTDAREIHSGRVPHPHASWTPPDVPAEKDIKRQEPEEGDYLVLASETESAAIEEQFEGESQSVDDENDESLRFMQSFSESFIKKHRLGINVSVEQPVDDTNKAEVTQLPATRKIRHLYNRLEAIERQKIRQAIASQSEPLLRRTHAKELIKDSLNGLSPADMHLRRSKRAYVKEVHVLDAKVGHGHTGNATEGETDESSVSSFENNLLTCYDGKILLTQPFPPSTTCTLAQVEENDHIMKTTHEVESDGYYYYIFYSDNDLVVNDMHAVFNIFKPTYQYANFSRGCMNQTECTFPISFWSDETVIVEVPTRDGIVKEDDDITFLISSCYPRMSVYAIFPISVLFLILGCAFL